MDWVQCNWCNKPFLKYIPYINENKKLGHKFYCSLRCQSLFRNKRVLFYCENPVCNKEFIKRRCEISSNNYCSRSCAATMNNTKFPKKIAPIRRCANCHNRLFNYAIYCSTKCSSIAHSISKEEVANRIKNFHKKHGRIPLKREMWGIYKPARKYFGTWNKAIEAAGFKPNPVMFSDRCIANDGHICDSVAEKIIDDYLYEKSIVHERSISYPKGNYTFDFRIGNILLEYFGLTGEHRKYDEIRKIKQKIVKKFNLHLVEIYPKDLYPHNKLEAILGY